MLGYALGGRYVNFGVFALYNDKALDHALEASLHLALSEDVKKLMEYPKASTLANAHAPWPDSSRTHGVGLLHE